jgi:phosphoglycerol transferase MdoB-like AlkP superfamily enzyme
MSSNTQTTTNGVSGLTLLGLLFVALKLTGFIDWSWWWVTFPFWGALAILGVVLLLFGLFLLLAFLFDLATGK